MYATASPPNPPDVSTSASAAATDAKSIASVKSESSVRRRAREYARKIDEERVRAKSLERKNHQPVGEGEGGGAESSPSGNRNVNNGGTAGRGLRERAMASVRSEMPAAAGGPERPSSSSFRSPNASAISRVDESSGDVIVHDEDGAGVGDNDGRGGELGEDGRGGGGAGAGAGGELEVSGDDDDRGASPRRGGGVEGDSSSSPRQSPRQRRRQQQQQQQSQQAKRRPSPGGGGGGGGNDDDGGGGGGGEAIVTPELLVDALSGHEDGLLAIAERLMEHYDAGYDAMGEAIIDAFADVQKLFQHVVEAAHMEGAAFESSRREAEVAQLRQQAAAATGGDVTDPYDPSHTAATTNVLGNVTSPSGSGGGGGGAGGANRTLNTSTGGPSRHDEFIDQDVRDVLIDAIRRGQPLRESDNHMECYGLYESACNSASALLPVDSDHRGRLQLSIARAESMSPDRACAILRYAIDDVLRSGLNRSGHDLLPDPSKRGDCVLRRPDPLRTRRGIDREGDDDDGSAADDGNPPDGVVVQSAEEALASLVEEMKEVLGAPVYEQTPLQGVADRFWVALGEAQRAALRNEERLEHSLGKLKGEFLLAREEWEEKITAARESAELYKKKYQELRDSSQQSEYMEQARTGVSRLADQHFQNGSGTREVQYTFNDTLDSSVRSHRPGGGASSVASLGSEFAQKARSLVGSFSCVSGGVGDRATDGEAGGGVRKQGFPRASMGGNNRSFSTPASMSSPPSREQKYPTHGLGTNDI